MKNRSSHTIPGLKLGTLITLVVFATLGIPAPCSMAQQDTRQLRRDQSQSNGTAQRRVALVIGNGAYTNAPPLKNPPNDARDMALTLKTLGFDVSSGININQREMKRLIRDFGQKLKTGGSGLFYYAGHGVQSNGRNYLIPVEADIQSEAEVEDSSVDVSLVLKFMDEAQNGLNIVILDACRNNPFGRSFRSASEGLAQVDAPTGTLIAYATAPGRVASDGAGQNGLYTSELLRQMRVPGLSATEMFMRVRAEVMRQTGNKQVPWEASSLVGTFYFGGGKSNPSSSDVGVGNKPETESRVDPAAFELSYWDSIKSSTDPEDFKAYLEKYPAGQFAALARNDLRRLQAVDNRRSETSSPQTSVNPTPTSNFSGLKIKLIYISRREPEATRIASRLRALGAEIILSPTSDSGNSPYVGKMFYADGQGSSARKVADSISDLIGLAVTPDLRNCNGSCFADGHHITIWIA